MKEARERWAGKTEQQQFLLMEANLKLQRKDINGALEVLASIPSTEASYQLARIKMAEIYLNEKKDKRKFAACFRYLLLCFYKFNNKRIREYSLVTSLPLNFSWIL